MAEEKKVGLYFGSFNPVHMGHINLACYLVEKNIVDEVWFVVSPCNPLKQQNEMLDENIRLKMLNMAIEGKPGLKSTDVEFSMPVPSYTYDTLKVLSSRFPDIKFSLIIGSDNTLLFSRWKNYKQILDNYQVLVYPRRGYDFKKIGEMLPQITELSTPYYDISSTEIREAISQGEDISQWLDPDVYDYILKNKLYCEK